MVALIFREAASEIIKTAALIRTDTRRMMRRGRKKAVSFISFTIYQSSSLIYDKKQMLPFEV